MMMRSYTLILLALLTFSAGAEMDGKVLYTTYCSACHGISGEGGAGDSAPPLKNSPWLKGDPQRAIKIVLHGLQGEMTLAGKTYNLAMPPQGAVLNNEQISAILNHVRKNMAKEKAGKPVTPNLVQRARNVTSTQESMYEVKELLKAHPLPSSQKKSEYLKGLLIESFYSKGKPFQTWPDFKALTPDSVEEEHLGLISLQDQNRKKSFAIVWDARFFAKHKGSYHFKLKVDDGARLLLNGKEVLSQPKQGPLTRAFVEAEVELEKGEHEFRLEYYQALADIGIELWVKGPKGKRFTELHERITKGKHAKKPAPPIELKPENGKVISYRNFMEGLNNKTISYGYPEGVHLTYSHMHANVQQMWKGRFIDAGLHFTGRAKGKTRPIGTDLISLNTTQRPSVKIGSEVVEVELWKIDQDGQNVPTFYSRAIGHPEVVLIDHYQPKKGGDGFIRTLKVEGSPAELTLPIKGESKNKITITTADGKEVEKDYKVSAPHSDKSITLDYSW